MKAIIKVQKDRRTRTGSKLPLVFAVFYGKLLFERPPCCCREMHFFLNRMCFSLIKLHYMFLLCPLIRVSEIRRICSKLDWYLEVIDRFARKSDVILTAKLRDKNTVMSRLNWLCDCNISCTLHEGVTDTMCPKHTQKLCTYLPLSINYLINLLLYY